MPNKINKMTTIFVLLLTLQLIFTINAFAGERQTRQYFKKIKNQPSKLRIFLKSFPKGGELHNHIDGAIFSENHIKWAAEDNKCINTDSFMVKFPPCDSNKQTVPVSTLFNNDNLYNKTVNAFSVRNYQWGNLSGHDQFFATFEKFAIADLGHFADMLVAVTSRSEKQNLHYLELMQSLGMPQAWIYAGKQPLFNNIANIKTLINDKKLKRIMQQTLKSLDREEARWKQKLHCVSEHPEPGCQVSVRYLAQVIRTFPNDQVLAQTILAFMLVQNDPRYVGINFVAPEDAPITLKNYTKQMQIIRDVAKEFPQIQHKIALHAGELTQGLVTNEALAFHIDEALNIAGAKRIGHGVDIAYEDHAEQILNKMSQEKIAIEINLTSNDVILGIQGNKHPFELYYHSGVPIVLSTDDEGVLRIDLTHEYQRAVETYNLSYATLKTFSRNSLQYSFLNGESLFSQYKKNKLKQVCAKSHLKKPSPSCKKFLQENDKARLQWDLEKDFLKFEKKF